MAGRRGGRHPYPASAPRRRAGDGPQGRGLHGLLAPRPGRGIASLATMSLSVVVAQPACVAFDVAANAVAHAETVRAADARVVVFPELSLTGYELSAPVLDPTDDRLRPLVEACADTGTVALVGAPVDGPCIAMMSVAGDAVRVIYKKLYLGGAEPARFLAGDSPAIYEIDGWRLGLAICKD